MNNPESIVRINGQRLWHSIMSMAEIGPGERGGSRRLALTDEDKQGRDLFIDWCEQANCSITIDDMGNIFALRSGNNNALPPIAAGSHLDTQPHGGKFDGIYGVLAALEVVRTMNDNDIETDAPVEIVMWTNEEGSRFAPAMISSGVFAGLFDKSFAWSRADVDGNTIEQELKRIGYMGDQQCGDHPMGALFEAHIEQGPILERDQSQVGVVIGGQGQRWFDVILRGQDSHAGSTPMSGRRDALVAAAELIQSVQKIALDFAPHGVGTVGEMAVSPNSRNTIPGEVFLTVDIRNPDDSVLKEMADRFQHCCDTASSDRNVDIDAREIWHNPPVKFDENCIEAVTSAANQLGYRHQEIVSGAGHDACQVCRVVPTSMIFVPCEGGLSHNEEEHATPEDLEAGCNVLLHAMLKLAG
jgi:N-carbamoyl-L-amino-acid hydrolase